jgi:hypothetical protein
VFAAELCCRQRISFRCQNCVVGSKSVRCRIVLPTANQFSLPKLCYLQQTRVRCRIVLSAATEFSLLNCVACSKLVFVAEWWCLQRIRFRCRMVLPAASQFSLSNHVACSELVFAAETMLSVAN